MDRKSVSKDSSKQQEVTSKFKKLGKVTKLESSFLEPQTGRLKMMLCPCGMNIKEENRIHKMLDKRFPALKTKHKEWYSEFINFKPGNILDIALLADMWLVNMMVEDDKGAEVDGALKTCLEKVVKLANENHGNIHVDSVTLSKFKGLEELLNELVVGNGINLFIYNK